MSKKCHVKLFRGCLLIALLSLLSPGCGREPAEESEVGLVPDHIGKARVFYHQANYTAAVEMYHKALELDPDNADTYLQLGIIYDDNLKDEEQAIYYYNQFLIREPDSEKAKRVRGWIAKSTEMIEEGIGKEKSEPVGSKSDKPSAAGAPAILLSSPAEVNPPRTEQEEIPAVVEEAEVNRYNVKEGDTLAGIAEKFYGTRTAWKRIYQANRDRLANPNALKVGQELTIPSDRN